MSDMLTLAAAINALALAINRNNDLAEANAGGAAPPTDAKPDKPKETKPKPDKKPAEDKKPEATVDLAATASAAVVALHKAKGRDVVIALLSKFDAKGAKDLKTDDDRASVIDLAEKLMTADGDDEINEILGGEEEFG